MRRNLLLISSSFHSPNDYLQHCFEEIGDFVGTRREVLFVPYASRDHRGYFSFASSHFLKKGIRLVEISEKRPRLSIQNAEALFVGGGNTFLLLKVLQELELLVPVRERILDGLPYVGVSAGTNIACPSIRTSNDMAIVTPPSLDALKVIGFNINPHYFVPDSSSKHMGETRQARIKEFQEWNHVNVVGLREGSYLRITNEVIELKGVTDAALFRLGEAETLEVSPPCRLIGLE